MLAKLYNTQKHAQRECGASLVEYAILVALIAIGVIVAAKFLGEKINGKMYGAGKAIEGKTYFCPEEDPDCTPP